MRVGIVDDNSVGDKLEVHLMEEACVLRHVHSIFNISWISTSARGK